VTLAPELFPLAIKEDPLLDSLSDAGHQRVVGQKDRQLWRAAKLIAQVLSGNLSFGLQRRLIADIGRGVGRVSLVEKLLLFPQNPGDDELALSLTRPIRRLGDFDRGVGDRL